MTTWVKAGTVLDSSYTEITSSNLAHDIDVCLLFFVYTIDAEGHNAPSKNKYRICNIYNSDYHQADSSQALVRFLPGATLII